MTATKTVYPINGKEISFAVNADGLVNHPIGLYFVHARLLDK